MGNYIGRLVLFVQKTGETVDHLLCSLLMRCGVTCLGFSWFSGCQKYWTYWLVGV